MNRMNQKRVARKSMKKNQIIELVWLKFDTIQQSGSNFLNLNDIHKNYKYIELLFSTKQKKKKTEVLQIVFVNFTNN